MRRRAWTARRLLGGTGLPALPAVHPARSSRWLAGCTRGCGAPRPARSAHGTRRVSSLGGLRERTVQRMADRPYTLLSCGMSIDGYLDSAAATPAPAVQRRPTSTGSTPCAPAATRSSSARPRSATTTRGCSSARPSRRGRAGGARAAAVAVKVTLTRRGDLDAGADFFATGDAEKLVYCAERGGRRRPARPARAGRDRRRRRRAGRRAPARRGPLRPRGATG